MEKTDKVIHTICMQSMKRMAAQGQGLLKYAALELPYLAMNNFG